MNAQATESRRPSALYAACYTLFSKLLKQNSMNIAEFKELKGESGRALLSPEKPLGKNLKVSLDISLPFITDTTDETPRFSLDILRSSNSGVLWSVDLCVDDEGRWIAQKYDDMDPESDGHNRYKGPKPLLRGIFYRGELKYLSLEQASELIQRCIDFYKSLPESED